MNSMLITGGAGFIGSHAALALRRQYPNATIIAIDNLRRRGSELNVARLHEAGVSFVHGDVRNPEDLETLGGADLLLECSADASVMAGLHDSPRYVTNTNLVGTVNCLEYCRKHGAAMIFLSTSRVYPIEGLNNLNLEENKTRFVLGKDQPQGVSAKGISEDFPLAGARSLYGATKLCSELLLEEYRAIYGLRSVVNRCGVIAGPWQMGKSDQGVVSLWVARHLFGGPLQYIGYGGTGKQVRDVLHVDDLIRLLLYQIEHLDTLDGQVFNVGGGRERSISLRELTALCEEATGNHIEIAPITDTRPADVPLYISDNSAVTAATGWQPATDPRNVVEDVCCWMKDNRGTLEGVFTNR